MIKKATKALSYFSFALLLLLFASIDINLCVKVDFSSFYSSIISFQQGLSPYETNPLTFLDSEKTASVNLNTPFFVILLYPLSFISYQTAFVIWQVGAFFALVGSLNIILKKYELDKPSILLAILFSFPIYTNFFIAQIATYVLFFITLGHYYLKNSSPKLAGFCFGIITGIKLFTGLLFFYLLAKREFKACATFLVVFIFTLLLPLLVCGQELYQQYFLAVKSINWYIHAWNGSLLGFIERSHALNFITTDESNQKYITFAILLMVFLSYLSILVWKKNQYKSNLFNLTLIYMLLLNPLSWLYYFILLLEPYMSLASKEKFLSIERKLSCLLLFILFAYPRHSDVVKVSTDLLVRLTTGSQYFYTLLLSLIIFIWPMRSKAIDVIKPEPAYYPFLKIIVLFFIFFMNFGFTATNLSKLVGNSGNWIAS